MAFLKQLVLVSIFLLIFLLSERYAKKRVPIINTLPSYFPTCYRNDPELQKCLLEATNQVRPFLAKGVPELRIPSFEPFIVPEIQLEQSANALDFKATLNNVTAHGLTKYEFSRFDLDVPNLQSFSEGKIPDLRLEGDLTISGRILGLPLEGNGKFTARIDSSIVHGYQKYQETTLKDGKIHIIPVTTNNSVEVIGLKVDLQGLFIGNKATSTAINKAINANVYLLFGEFKPVAERTINKISEDVFNFFYENIPYDGLYPVKK